MFVTSLPHYAEPCGPSEFLVGPDGQAQAVAIAALGADDAGPFVRAQ